LYYTLKDNYKGEREMEAQRQTTTNNVLSKPKTMRPTLVKQGKKIRSLHPKITKSRSRTTASRSQTKLYTAQISQSIKAKPLASVLIAACVGFVFNALFNR